MFVLKSRLSSDKLLHAFRKRDLLDLLLDVDDVQDVARLDDIFNTSSRAR